MRHCSRSWGLANHRIRKGEAPGPTPWPGARQPERWQIAFAVPKATVNAEYWVGNQSVSSKRMDPEFAGERTAAHGNRCICGLDLAHTDTLAGALIALSLTGILTDEAVWLSLIGLGIGKQSWTFVVAWLHSLSCHGMWGADAP